MYYYTVHGDGPDGRRGGGEEVYIGCAGVGGGGGPREKNVFIRMVECHAGLEIAPYISSAMRREILFSTSQKPRTHGGGVGTRETVVRGERDPAHVSISTF